MVRSKWSLGGKEWPARIGLWDGTASGREMRALGGERGKKGEALSRMHELWVVSCALCFVVFCQLSPLSHRGLHSAITFTSRRNGQSAPSSSPRHPQHQHHSHNHTSFIMRVSNEKRFFFQSVQNLARSLAKHENCSIDKVPLLLYCFFSSLTFSISL